MEPTPTEGSEPVAQDYDPQKFRQALDEKFAAEESRVHQLASKTDAEFAFLAFAAYQFFQISIAEGRIDEYEHGNMPASVEMAAYYLYQHIGEFQETDNEVVAEIIEMVPDLYHLNLMASGMGSCSDDLAGNVIGPSKIHAQSVRGSAWPDQTKSEILGIQGAFDSWFTNRIGLSPSRAIAILELVEDAINIQVNEAKQGVYTDSPPAPDPSSNPETIRDYFQEAMNRMVEKMTRAIAVDRESVPIQPKITAGEWTALLDLVGLTPSAVQSMSSAAEVSQRPLFVIGGDRAFYLDQSTLYDALYDAFDLVARGDQKFYSGKYTDHLSAWVEGQTMAHLARIFPPEALYSNLTYPDPDKPVGEAELDGLILWGPFQILIEVKGRQFRLAGRLNEPGKLRTDLKRNIEDAFDQALRAQRYIDASPAPEFKEKGSRRIAKVNKTGKHFRFVISVSLHHLGPITTQLAVLKEVGLLKNGQYPWSVCLADLEVICQFAGSPDVLLHYVKRRVELQQSERAIMGDELDLFGNYHDTRLHPSIYWNRKTDTGGDYDFMHIAGGSERFQEWKETELGLRPSAPEIELSIPEPIKAVLQELRRRDQDEARWLAIALLDFHPEDLDHLSSAIETQRTVSIPAGHRPRISYKNDHDETVVTIITGDPSESRLIRDLTRRRSLLEKYRHRSNKAIGFSMDPSIKSSPIDLAGYYEFPWVEDPALEKKLAEEPLRMLPGAKLPGRNDPCPCGSRKKFKKCCLPRTRLG